MAVRFDSTKEVPSLELCERLKKLGFPQDGEGWCWRKEAGGNFLGVLIDKSDLGWTLLEYVDGFWVQSPYLCWKELKKLIKAPTVRELGEWLPNEFCSGRIMDYLCENMELDPAVKDKYPIMHADTEANARAKMIIWLVENGYIKFKEAK